VAGSLAGERVVYLHYDLAGVASAQDKLLPLARLLHLCQHGAFARSLFPADPRMERRLLILRIYDAVADGASHRDIASALFGQARINQNRRESSDALRSRVRRLIREARRLGRGGYRSLMRPGEPPSNEPSP
jgi:hypothetical protein